MHPPAFRLRYDAKMLTRRGSGRSAIGRGEQSRQLWRTCETDYHCSMTGCIYPVKRTFIITKFFKSEYECHENRVKIVRIVSLEELGSRVTFIKCRLDGTKITPSPAVSAQSKRHKGRHTQNITNAVSHMAYGREQQHATH